MLCIVCKSNVASYNVPGKNPEYCALCKVNGMIFMRRKCMKCNNRSLYNYPKLPPEYCWGCKKPGMIDVAKCCIVCQSRPGNYNYPYSCTPKFCDECKTDGMIMIYHKSNKHCSRCGRAPSSMRGGVSICKNCLPNNYCVVCEIYEKKYNKPGKPPKFCFICRTDDMVLCAETLCSICNVRKIDTTINNSSMCEKCITFTKCINCNINNASYNFVGYPKAFCERCKYDGMVIANMTCKKCPNEAEFNYKNHPPEYCKSCKLRNMIDTKIAKCCMCEKKYPMYTMNDGNKYCELCKSKDMIHVYKYVNLVQCINCRMRPACCKIPGRGITHCRICSTFNMVRISKRKCVECIIGNAYYKIKNFPPRYCKSCKTYDMVYYRKKAKRKKTSIPKSDVIDLTILDDETTSLGFETKKCIECGNKTARFGLPYDPAKYCRDCKTDKMIAKNSKCIECGIKHASFNYYGCSARYCSDCKKPGMQSVKRKKCVVCKDVFPSFNYEGCSARYCVNCKTDSMVYCNRGKKDAAKMVAVRKKRKIIFEKNKDDILLFHYFISHAK